MQQKTRTIHARRASRPSDDFDDGPGSVLIAAIGSRARLVQPGRTVRDTLRDAGVMPPGSQQRLSINGEEVRDLDRVLQEGDRVIIVNKVAAGARRAARA